MSMPGCIDMQNVFLFLSVGLVAINLILMEFMQNTIEKEERIKIIYFPIDCKNEIRKILKRIDLKLLILIETEIWPNLISCAKIKVKVILVNGRISDKSFGRYMKLKRILKNVLG